MLASFLKSVDNRYKIEFRTDTDRRLLIARITRGFLYKEVLISFELLSDENYIIATLQMTIDSLEDAYGNA